MADAGVVGNAMLFASVTAAALLTFKKAAFADATVAALGPAVPTVSGPVPSPVAVVTARPPTVLAVPSGMVVPPE